MENQPILDPKDGVDPAKRHNHSNRYFGLSQPMMVGIVAICCFLGIVSKMYVSNTNINTNTTYVTHIVGSLRLPITGDRIPSSTTSTGVSLTQGELSFSESGATDNNNLDAAVLGGGGCCPSDDEVNCSCKTQPTGVIDCNNVDKCSCRGTSNSCCLNEVWDSHIWWMIHVGGCVGCCKR